MRKTRRVAGLLMILAGIFLIAYPLSMMLYQKREAPIKMKDYNDRLASYSQEQIDALRAEVEAYRKRMEEQEDAMNDPFTTKSREPLFEKVEDEFGYIVIPKLQEQLPIYLGATDEHLEKGLAQVEGTSIPWGGEGTHSVLAGHRGYYNHILLLNAEQLEVGDPFYLYVLRDRLVYRVYEIDVIDPEDTESLYPVPGRDLVTLLTCHPRTTLDRRLLIHAERDLKEEALFKEEAALNSQVQEEPDEKTPIESSDNEDFLLEMTREQAVKDLQQQPTSPVVTIVSRGIQVALIVLFIGAIIIVYKIIRVLLEKT